MGETWFLKKKWRATYGPIMALRVMRSIYWKCHFPCIRTGACQVTIKIRCPRRSGTRTCLTLNGFGLNLAIRQKKRHYMISKNVLSISSYRVKNKYFDLSKISFRNSSHIIEWHHITLTLWSSDVTLLRKLNVELLSSDCQNCSQQHHGHVACGSQF